MSADVGHEPSGDRKRKMPRWAWIVLVCSLAFNLLFVGGVVGSFWAYRHGHWPGMGMMFKRAQFYRELPRERRKVIRQLVRDFRKANRPLWEKVHQARRAAGDVLVAKPYDEEAFLAALAALNEAECNARKAAEPLVVNMVQKLKPEERKGFLKIFRHRRGRFGHHHHKFGHPHKSEPQSEQQEQKSGDTPY